MLDQVYDVSRFHVSAEIDSQPDCWRRAAAEGPAIDGLPEPGEAVAFVGCGTSWFMAQVVARWREDLGLGLSDAFTASEVPDRRYDRVVAITRSGTTTEVVELLRRFTGAVPTTVLTAVPDAPVAAVSDRVVDLSYADEESVVQTRFATTVLALFRSTFGVDLEPVVAAAEAALVEPVPEALVGADQISFLGTGWSIGIAHEAALKFRETSSSWAESYGAMEYRHGPISVAGPNRITWMFGPAPDGLAAQVEATGAWWVDADRDPMADLVAVQRLAVARAAALGMDPDRPRHLTRSIILTP